jgi:hypothetical protein
MTMEDENMDQLFREADAAQTFEFKEEYWSKMEALLPKKRKNKQTFFWLIGGVTLCIGISGFLLGSRSTELKETIQPLIKDQQQQTTASSSTTGKVVQKSGIFTIPHPAKASSIPSVAKDNTPSHRAAKEFAGTENRDSNPIAQADEQLFTKLKNLEKRKEGIQYRTEITPSSKSTGVLPIIQVSQLGVVYDLPLLPFPSVAINQVLEPGMFLLPTLHKWSCLFDLKTTMGQSPIYSNSLGSNLAYGFGFGAGLNYSSTYWDINAGITLSQTSYNNLSVLARVKQYGFGSVNNDVEIKYQQIYSMDFPLMIGVKKNRHSVQFGIVPSVNLGPKITYENTVEGTTIASSTHYGYPAELAKKGFSKGISTFGLKPTVGYVFKLTNDLSIGGAVQIQLITPVNTELFDGVANHSPINGQLFIRRLIYIK